MALRFADGDIRLLCRMPFISATGLPFRVIAFGVSFDTRCSKPCSEPVEVEVPQDRSSPS